LLDSLRNFAQTLIGAVQTRLELFSNELEEQGARLARIALLWALAAFCFALAIVLGSVLIVVMFWDTNRVMVLALLTGAFTAGGLVALLIGRSALASRPKALAGTIAELARDRAAL
jgi:uncharacterized membrane protein YqjE